MSRTTPDWHNPDPGALGEIIFETKTLDGRNKAVIIRNTQGHCVVHGYFLDDSDLVAGFSKSVGWVSESGPSITDTLERARKLAEEYLTRGIDRPGE